MSRRSRDKGIRGEQEAVDFLRLAFPQVARRDSSMGRKRDLDGTPGWCIQVCVAAFPWMERKFLEARQAAGKDEVPLALTKKTPQGEWLATLRATDLLSLVKKAESSKLLSFSDVAESLLRAINEHLQP